MRGKDKLGPYYDKRSADSTPEPYGLPARTPPGRTAIERPRIFVVQKHAARRMHYDLRLEMNGVLESWAVPQGPSFDPAIKRLAVKVEAHPLNYADFEGVIPEGNYGAGSMIVWDRGIWVPLEDPDEGLERGNLKFELKGYKLRGKWGLVKTKGDTTQWLLIKKADAWAAPEGKRKVAQESILSGLTVEDLKEGQKHIAEIAGEMRASGAGERALQAKNLKVMLAETAEAPFTRDGWIFELKYDGFRLLCSRDDGEIRLFYRSGNDATHIFPDVVRTLSALPFHNFIFDAEVVVLDDEAKPSIHRLQQRTQWQRGIDIERAAVAHPATLYVFDLLSFEGLDLRALPLVDRKAFLQKLLPKAGPMRFAEHIETRGEDFFKEVEKLGLEGIMGKRAQSRYTHGRSGDWLKIPAQKSGDFVVVGFTKPDKITRNGFRNLILACYQGSTLTYAGKVGSGFSEQLLGDIREKLEPLITDEKGFAGEVERSRGGEEWVWLEPKLVAEIRYLHFSEDGHLRFPVFQQLRTDKTADDLAHEFDPPPPLEDPQVAEPEGTDAAALRQVPFTNLDKVFWEEEPYTKGDLIEYYKSISDWLLPYIVDRPVVLTRFPDGIKGKSFYQKDAPPFVPGWVRTERMWSEHSQREIDYFVCDDLESLLYLINLGSIPIHMWMSRASSLQHPDWSLLDLDPKKASFAKVIEVANAIRALCEEIGLPTYVKTTGSTGLHIMVPLGGKCTYEQSRSLSSLIGHVISREMPDDATMTRNIQSRGERVYIDWLQNRHGQLMVSPLSVRPLDGAPVSMMLEWSEVKEGLDPQQWTIANARERLEAMGPDPMRPVLEMVPDLGKVIDALKAHVQSGGA
jgi:bifunctional non-homologous end joining protein LigD